MAPKITHTTALLLGASLAALCAATPSLADDSEFFSLDPIIVEGKDPESTSADKAASVYVADAELERARMGDLKDLFAGIASVSVGGAIPVAQKIFVNGVDMLNLAITVDGVSQNNRIFHHASANAFDPGLMKFVRVDPGVAAADDGPNAMAGAVRMETIDVSDLLEDGDSFGGTYRLSFGDNGETLQNALTLGGREGNFEYLAYLKRAEGKNYTAGDGSEVTGTAANLWAGLVKLAHTNQSGGRLEFSAQRMDDTELRNDKANFGPGRWGINLYDTERTIYSLSFEANNSGEMWDPTFAVGFSETVVNKPNPYGSMGTTNTVSAKFQNTFHLSLSNTVTAGLDFYDRTGDYSDPTDGSFSETARNHGIFAQWRVQPTDRLNVSAGARYDWQKFDGKNAADPTYSYSGASGNLSLVYDVTDSFSVRGGYSNIFGGVQIEDNYQFWRTFNYASLEAARAQNIVLGADFSRGGLTIGGELFRTRIADVREFDSNYDFESEGFNIYGTYGWHNGFARLTFAHSEVERDGVPMSSDSVLDSGTPVGSIIAFEVQQEIESWNLLIGGSLDVALDFDSGASEYADIQELPGYEVVNIFAEYSPPSLPNLKIRAEIQNLFDEDYADRATFGGDFSGFSTLKEPGRTLMISAVTYF
ncbi:TonB-dependent receptor [Shimia sp. CNT1-13L.2]|uniref:TonB-dependent receptor plug domain-containing protein n=1 Tax=Shimia sp. CNT1-13L.2 TaxID=2959663 RepID=UPI0020CFB65F|nr:TonB-dependent receptor [Shimia sp. CNT1-13L.2]MCP9484099.1 TonB-dependent receptor [Shimia sp. CNT1-13L.2]